MKVRDVMRTEVESCAPGTDLAAAAMIMWNADCGFVPVVEPGTRKVKGVITDRDICMALATTGKRPNERKVEEVMARTPFVVRPEDPVADLLAVMEREHIRRLPVVGRDQTLVGVVSMNDLVLATQSGWRHDRPHLNAHDVMRALRGICAHRRPAEDEALVAVGHELL